jgi:single stranded DNA-binding protein
MSNQITLLGHVGKNPVETSFADTGNKVVKFSIAVKEFSKSEEEKTLWIDVESWNGLGERVMNLITKGREVQVIGRLALSKYSKEVNGQQVEMVKPIVKLSSFHLCGKKPQEEGEAQAPTNIKASRKTKKVS